MMKSAADARSAPGRSLANIEATQRMDARWSTLDAH
jgi:hypothetical protein